MNSKLIGGILLVAGTTIGAGMLALPISTGLAGFIPSVLLLVLVWIFMTYTALLLLEVNLAVSGGNIISMAKATLGPLGQIFSWFTYLFLLYALNTAYIAGSRPSFLLFFEYITGISEISNWVGSIPLFLIFGYFVYQGTRSVDYINRLLMGGLILTYILMVIFVTSHIKVDLLLYHQSCFLIIAAPVVVTSFGFHIIIPSLSQYMNGNVKLIKKAILIGSAIPVFVYILWEGLTLGVVPIENDFGILDAYRRGISGSNALASVLSNPWIALVARFFSLFAIITSFLGVALSLTDFLADGLQIKRTHRGRLLLCLLTFAPPLVISLTYPRAFLTALEYAGAYGVVMLLCLLPALMAWFGRYRLKYTTLYRAPGGKGLLIFVMLVSIIIMGMEAANKLGYITVGFCN